MEFLQALSEHAFLRMALLAGVLASIASGVVRAKQAGSSSLATHFKMLGRSNRDFSVQFAFFIGPLRVRFCRCKPGDV